MTKNSSNFHLPDILTEIPHPRNKKGKRHPLRSPIRGSITSVISQQKSYPQKP